MSELLTKQSELKVLADKYGPTLATKPHPKFSNKTLRDQVDYALRCNYISIVKSTIKHIKSIEHTLELPPISDGYILAYGKTWGLNDRFNQYGFTLKQFGGVTWCWYREILSDKYGYWCQLVESIGPDIECLYVSDLGNAVPALEEAKSADFEMKSIDIDSDPASLLPHDLDGHIFEVTKWYASKLKEAKGTQYAFRNLKILKVKKESPKAYCVDAEFFSGIASRCGVCGRELNNDISRATGIGPICAVKIGMPRPTMERAKEIVAELEKLSKAQGIFNNVWVPKSQIKEIINREDSCKKVS